jgi:DNA polymerase (family 10)
VRGGNPYRAKAYTRAAENLSALTVPLDQVIRTGRLREIPGVGEAIADIITVMHRTGTHPSLEKMRSEIPSGVIDLLRVPGLRSEKVLKLYKELGVDSLDSLQEAAAAGRLKPVKGLGAALEAKILQGLAILRKGEGQRHLHRAAEMFDALVDNIKRSHAGVQSAEPAGTFRRGCELVDELTLVVTLKRESPPTLTTGPARIVFTSKQEQGAALLAATGSAAHFDQLQNLAGKKGLRLDEHGLWKGRKRVAGASEEAIYAALDLPFIAPELR